MDAESRVKIEAVRDPEALRGLLARAMSVTSVGELFASGTAD